MSNAQDKVTCSCGWTHYEQKRGIWWGLEETDRGWSGNFASGYCPNCGDRLLSNGETRPTTYSEYAWGQVVYVVRSVRGSFVSKGRVSHYRANAGGVYAYSVEVDPDDDAIRMVVWADEVFATEAEALAAVAERRSHIRRAADGEAPADG